MITWSSSRISSVWQCCVQGECSDANSPQEHFGLHTGQRIVSTAANSPSAQVPQSFVPELYLRKQTVYHRGSCAKGEFEEPLTFRRVDMAH